MILRHPLFTARQVIPYYDAGQSGVQTLNSSFVTGILILRLAQTSQIFSLHPSPPSLRRRRCILCDGNFSPRKFVIEWKLNPLLPETCYSDVRQLCTSSYIWRWLNCAGVLLSVIQYYELVLRPFIFILKIVARNTENESPVWWQLRGKKWLFIFGVCYLK